MGNKHASDEIEATLGVLVVKGTQVWHTGIAWVKRNTQDDI
jgi:hypothetical protein